MKHAAIIATLGLSIAAGAQVTYAPDGGTRETLQSILISAKPGAPFQATVTTSWKRRMEDGTETTIYNHRTVARDSTGRIFQERRYFSPTGNTDTTALSELDYYDPARKEMTVCVPQRRTCSVHNEFVPVDDPLPQPLATTTPNGVKITRESIGEKTVANLQVQGAHEITIYPKLGESEPTVKELWYSPLLGFNVEVRRFQPRGGAQDIAVQTLTRNEPDPRLFTPPEDYALQRTVNERAARPLPPPPPAVPDQYGGGYEGGVILHRSNNGGEPSQPVPPR